ncbi:DUF2237 family protein [Cyclobacterium amurskyense]|uniref:DUF2237 family protein n=1 Tax=Cyclobacterium amurskyense TaxID=320787 RepID=UPI001F0A910F|nr:DUF2237 family protein [Cyclobacterium amurskyense]
MNENFMALFYYLPILLLLMANNAFGEALIPCCFSPRTGFYRDGYCQTDEQDTALHT